MACQNVVGLEPVNWAYLTFNGKPHAAPDPISLLTGGDAGNPNPATDLQMNGGDRLQLHMFDTPAGFKVVLNDLTTGQTGSMTASAANGFQQVLYQPNSKTCNEAPYSFHPEFATSTRATRSSWAAHTYNVAGSDEIGHFEWLRPRQLRTSPARPPRRIRGAGGRRLPLLPGVVLVARPGQRLFGDLR